VEKGVGEKTNTRLVVGTKSFVGKLREAGQRPLSSGKLDASRLLREVRKDLQKPNEVRDDQGKKNKFKEKMIRAWDVTRGTGGEGPLEDEKENG